jgi:hypothetical protein
VQKQLLEQRGEPMNGCERILKCPMVNAPGSAPERIKEEYCYNNYSQCARYKVLTAVGGEFVPPDLLPHQHEEANEIIEEAREL